MFETQKRGRNEANFLRIRGLKSGRITYGNRNHIDVDVRTGL